MEAQDLLAQQNIFSLTQEQAERVDVLKAEIAQGVLTGDIIGELLLKAVEALAICTNDKKYLMALKRVVKNVWHVYGMNYEDIPQAFDLQDAEERLLALREAECFKSPQEKADIQAAIRAQERRIEHLTKQNH